MESDRESECMCVDLSNMDNLELEICLCKSYVKPMLNAAHCQKRGNTCVEAGERLSRDELGAVDELGEVCARGVHWGSGDGPVLWILLSPDLLIH